MTYPSDPGYRVDGPSCDAAESMRKAAQVQRAKCYAAIVEAQRVGRSGDETAALIGMDNWKVRPRLSELKRDKLIRDSGRRVINASGRKATIWVACVFDREDAR